MKKIISAGAVVMMMCFVIGCGNGSKYKTFNEEAANLNAEYNATVQSVFQQQNKNTRKQALQKVQQEYDAAFAEIAKRWKVNASTSTSHINFQNQYCTQMIETPYQQKVDEIVNKYSSDFSAAFSAGNSSKMGDIARRLGTELGNLTVLYQNKAKSAECSFTEVNISDVMDSMIGA